MEFLTRKQNKQKQEIIESITTEEAIKLALTKFNASYINAVKELEQAKIKEQQAHQVVVDKLARVQELQGLKDSFTTQLNNSNKGGQQ